MGLSAGFCLLRGIRRFLFAIPGSRGSEGEIHLSTYDKLKKPGAFSEEILGKVLRGISERRYGETVIDAAPAFGVSASAISRRIVEATTPEAQGFQRA